MVVVWRVPLLQRTGRIVGVLAVTSAVLGPVVYLEHTAPRSAPTTTAAQAAGRPVERSAEGAGERSLERPEGLVDGSAPAASSVVQNPLDVGEAAPGTGAGPGPTPSPGASDPAAIPPGTVPVGGPGFTPGTGTRPSQPTGRGYVDTQVENQLPGTPGWQAARSGRQQAIEGFADATSVSAGEPVRVFVSSTAPTFRIQLLRIGWYGGSGARQVWLSAPVRGGVQAPAVHDPATRMISAPWQVSATLPTEGLVAGDYVLKLLGADGASSFVPLVVRETRSDGALVMLNSTLTWLAYNPWGGANTYTASTARDDEGYEGRSVIASMDRPYARGSGTGGFFDEEYHLVLTAERLGLKLNYAADLDLHARPEVLSGAVGVALLGHSEYWSRQMRSALTAARDRGANLAFLGANDVFRRIRVQGSELGPFRRMVNYKDGTQDPEQGADTTANWPHTPHKDPQAELTGVQYRCARARADLVVTQPDGWLFSGLGLVAGQKLPGMIGPEFDRVVLAVPTPRPMQIMAHSPVSCYGYPDYADLVWYSTASGAGVFAAGTLDWNQGLTSPDRVTRRVVTTVTERVLKAVARPRAGLTTPADDNVLRHYSPSGLPLDAQGKPLAPPKKPPATPSVDR